MRFWANKEYVRPIGIDGKPVLETYIFHPGAYYPSANESEEDAISFETVARILVEQLGNQNFQMTQEGINADYILIINWGQTTPEADMEDVVYEGFSSVDELASDDLIVEELSESKRRENARLLGASKMYNMSTISLKKRLLEEAIVQDRYFINIFAVSIHDIRNRNQAQPDKKGNKPKLKATWECQLSVPTDHDDPAEAFKAMAKSGSSYFGKNVNDITFMKEGTKQGVVTIGEIRFIDDDESEVEEEQK